MLITDNKIEYESDGEQNGSFTLCDKPPEPKGINEARVQGAMIVI